MSWHPWHYFRVCNVHGNCGRCDGPTINFCIFLLLDLQDRKTCIQKKDKGVIVYIVVFRDEGIFFCGD